MTLHANELMTCYKRNHYFNFEKTNKYDKRRRNKVCK